MSRSQPIIFVLWSSNFEEAAAALFVTELRQVGLRVKVVGLRGPYMPGLHGLVLLPDMTLAQALPFASKASCVVLPCTSKRIEQLKNDPRITTFLQAAEANCALFVIGRNNSKYTNSDDQRAGSSHLLGLHHVLSYPPVEVLVAFVREVANQLLQRKSNSQRF